MKRTKKEKEKDGKRHESKMISVSNGRMGGCVVKLLWRKSSQRKAVNLGGIVMMARRSYSEGTPRYRIVENSVALLASARSRNGVIFEGEIVMAGWP